MMEEQKCAFSVAAAASVTYEESSTVINYKCAKYFYDIGNLNNY